MGPALGAGLVTENDERLVDDWGLELAGQERDLAEEVACPSLLCSSHDLQSCRHGSIVGGRRGQVEQGVVVTQRPHPHHRPG